MENLDLAKMVWNIGEIVRVFVSRNTEKVELFYTYRNSRKFSKTKQLFHYFCVSRKYVIIGDQTPKSSVAEPVEPTLFETWS